METTLAHQYYIATPKFPPELFKNILDNLDNLRRQDRRKALKAGALTCSLFRDICQPKLFEILRISRGNHFFIPPLGHPASSLLAILQGSRHLHRYIKAIHISNGESAYLVSCGVCDRNVAAILGLLGDLRQLVISNGDGSDEVVDGLQWRDLGTELSNEISKRSQWGTIPELFFYNMRNVPYGLFYPRTLSTDTPPPLNTSPFLETLTLSSVELYHRPLPSRKPPFERGLQRLRRFNIRVAEAKEMESLYSIMTSIWWIWDLTRLVEFTLHIPSRFLRDETATLFSDILHECLGTLEFLTLYAEHPEDTPSSFKEEFELLSQAVHLNNFELRASLGRGSTLTSARTLQSLVWFTSILNAIPSTTREVDVVIEVCDDGDGSMVDDSKEEWDRFASTLLCLANTAAVTIYFLVLPWSSFDVVRSRLFTLLARVVRRSGHDGLKLTVIPGKPGCLWWKERRVDILDSVEPVQADL